MDMKMKTDEQKNIKVVQFLEAYEKQVNLWNPNVENYKNKAVRDVSYLHIIHELGKPNLTINDIKLKIKSIRTTYTKELRLLTKHKELGKPYTPKLFWFNRANTFLRDVSLSRDKRINFAEKFKRTRSHEFKTNVMDYITDNPVDELSQVEQDNCHSDSNTFEYKALTADNMDMHMNGVQSAGVEDELSAKSTVIMSQQPDFPIATLNGNNNNNGKYTTPTETRYSDVGSAYITTTSISNNTLQQNTGSSSQNNTQTNIVEDEFDIFCRSVAAQLRSIKDIYSRSVAKLKIQQILFEAETGHYRNQTSVTIPAVADSQQLNTI